MGTESLLSNALVLAALLTGLWICISVLISHVGGWASLQDIYRLNGEFTGRKWSFQSASMRYWINYGNCLTVGANSEGLYVSPFALLRAGHPALFIPWRDSTASRKRVLGTRVVELRLGRELGIPFRIHEKLAERLGGAAGTSWPAETK